MQVYVVVNKKHVFVFTNHDAALRCRRDLKLNHWKLWGCGINDGWHNGQPVAADGQEVEVPATDKRTVTD